MGWHSPARYGTVRYGMVWYGMEQVRVSMSWFALRGVRQAGCHGWILAFLRLATADCYGIGGVSCSAIFKII